MTQILKGIIPPVITPLINNNTLDVDGLERLIEHLINGGVHGLFLLGTNGEAPSLSYKLRKELISKACEFNKNRVPILVGITDTSFDGSIEIAKHAHSQGVQAVVVAPPYYMPISQNEMMTYLENLSSALPLPFVLYNMPSCTKLHLSIETVRKARELGAIGIKDSSGDMTYLYTLIDEFKEYPEFSVMAGTELYLPDMVMNGGDGAVAGGANIFPKLFVDLYEASLKKDLKTIALLRKKVMKLYNTLYNIGDTPTRITTATKCALSQMEICNAYMAHPLNEFNEKNRNLVAQYLKELS